MSEDGLADTLTLEFLLQAFGPAVVSLQVAPAGLGLPIRSVALLDTDDLATAERGVMVADLCILAGLSAADALSWIDRIALDPPRLRPAMVVIKGATDELCRAAESVGVAVGTLHPQARADMVLSTVRSLIEGAAGRVADAGSGDELPAEDSDLYSLAQRVAAMTGGLVSIEDDQSRLLAYSATDGAADELRMLSILGREGPAEHLRRLRELGVYQQLQVSDAVVEVPADEIHGWRRRLVVSIRRLGSASNGAADNVLGTIWLQEGRGPLEPDSGAVLEGAAAIAARLIYRIRTAPSHEAVQIQRLLGLRGGGVDVPSLAAALALPTVGPAALVGITVREGPGLGPLLAELASAVRLLAGAYVRESLVATSHERIYVLLPTTLGSQPLAKWVGGVLDRLKARFGRELRAAIADPVPGLELIPAARGEVDRVLDRPATVERVTTLTRSRTPILLGEICELIGAEEKLLDPRLQTLADYDQDRGGSLVQTVECYLQQFGDIRVAAETLHIHPNTLRYRVRRAEQVLGMSLDDPDSRLLIQLQLLVRRRNLIAAQSHPPSGSKPDQPQTPRFRRA